MVNFSGIGSGIDFASLTDQLVRAARFPASTVEAKKSTVNQQIDRVGSLISRLETLKSRAESLDSADELRSMTASSSNEDTVEVIVSDAADPGSYALRVDSLASSQINVSEGLASDSPGLAGIGMLGIQVGSDAAVNISVNGNHSLSDIADMINASDARVSASVINDGSAYRLMVQAEDAGLANQVTFSESGLNLGLGANELQSAQDAQLELNGLAITRSSNQIDDLLPGVTLNLKREMQVDEAAVEINVANDPEGLKEKLQSFVDAYNNVVGMVSLELSAGKSGETSGPLAGDTTLQGLQRRIQSIASRAYGYSGGSTTLGSIGLEVLSDGGLSIDDAKFDEMLKNDPEALTGLFVGDGASSLTAVVGSMVTEYTQSGTGILRAKTDGLQSRIERYDERIEDINDSADRLETRLRRQFAAADVRIAELNSQMSYVTNAFFGNQQSE